MPFLLFYCVLPDLAVNLEPRFGFRLAFFMASYFLFVLCIPFFMLFYLFLAYFYFTLFFLVDVLQSGIWREANSLVDPSLRRLVPSLLHLQLESKAPSTVQKYRSGWLKWRQWAAAKIGVQVIPAKPLHDVKYI